MAALWRPSRVRTEPRLTPLRKERINLTPAPSGSSFITTQSYSESHVSCLAHLTSASVRTWLLLFAGWLAGVCCCWLVFLQQARQAPPRHHKANSSLAPRELVGNLLPGSTAAAVHCCLCPFNSLGTLLQVDPADCRQALVSSSLTVAS